jgi:hypothetical protein
MISEKAKMLCVLTGSVHLASSPRSSPGTPPRARDAAGNSGHGGGCAQPAGAATFHVAAVGCSDALAPPKAVASPRPSRSLSLPVLNKDLKSSPGTPKARGQHCTDT